MKRLGFAQRASEEEPVDWTLEVVILPVSDIDRSIAFYRDKVASTSTTTPGPSRCMSSRCRVAVTSAEQLDEAALADIAAGHHREKPTS